MKILPVIPLLIISALTVGAQEPAADADPTAAVTGSVAPAPAPAAPAAVPTVSASAPAPPKVMPSRHGDCTGPAYIGHRVVTERYTEWGWVWREQETYRKGRWTIIEEQPGVRMIPSRFLNNINGDDHYEYKLYGEFAPYKGYDPNYDLFVEVFRLKGFEVIGPAEPVKLKPPLSASKRRGNSSASRSRGIDFDY
ncbi:MAG: hypothetical protein LBK71_09895 [Verrucomicrobiales bacterium]|jgi:hypothetical protein|nr:hypothetical protein [Verrucomicrobiales bacterium]